MKNTLIVTLFLILLLPMGAYCQLGKGSYLGSFSTGFSYNYYQYTLTNYSATGDLVYRTNSVNFSLTSNMGYFVADRFVIGPGISIGTEYIQYSDDVDGSVYRTHSNVYSIAFSPFLRYYFAAQGKLAFFSQINGSIGYGQNFYRYPTEDGVTQKETTSILVYGGGAGLGLVYFLVDHIGMETQLAYNFLENNLKKDVHKTNSVNSAVTFGIGISYYFYKKK